MDPEIKKILDDHENRLQRLEGTSKPKSTPAKLGEKKTLADVIITVRNGGFFSSPKTAEETHDKIQAGYPCEVNRVAVALIRLSSRKELRIASKTVNGKKLKAYAW